MVLIAISGDKGSSKKAQKVLLVINKTSSCSREEVKSWDSLDGMGVAQITGYKNLVL